MTETEAESFTWSSEKAGPIHSCPLYVADTAWHCGIYPARPLICRLFAFAAVRDKHGHDLYALCKLMPSPSTLTARSASGAAIAPVFGAVPPLMANLGAALAAIDPDAAGNRQPLHLALRDAMSRVLFHIGLGGMTRQDDDPDITPPLPKAG
jgi:Fe-S-cluster containining protein